MYFPLIMCFVSVCTCYHVRLQIISELGDNDIHWITKKASYCIILSGACLWCILHFLTCKYLDIISLLHRGILYIPKIYIYVHAHLFKIFEWLDAFFSNDPIVPRTFCSVVICLIKPHIVLEWTKFLLTFVITMPVPNLVFNNNIGHSMLHECSGSHIDQAFNLSFLSEEGNVIVSKEVDTILCLPAMER